MKIFLPLLLVACLLGAPASAADLPENNVIGLLAYRPWLEFSSPVTFVGAQHE